MVAIAVAFLVAEVVRPTSVPSKRVAAHALVLASQDVDTPRAATLDPELLIDLPRIHPDAPTTISEWRHGVIRGRIVDPYTGRAGAAVFPIVDGVRLAAFEGSYRDERYIIHVATSYRKQSNVAIGLVANDQRGFFLSSRSLAVHFP